MSFSLFFRKTSKKIKVKTRKKTEKISKEAPPENFKKSGNMLNAKAQIRAISSFFVHKYDKRKTRKTVVVPRSALTLKATASGDSGLPKILKTMLSNVGYAGGQLRKE